jgi:hypothetical protein
MRIILQWILEEQHGRAWAGFIWLRIRNDGEFVLSFNVGIEPEIF